MWLLKDLCNHCSIHSTRGSTFTNLNGKWIPARPENWKFRSLRQRFREAKAVFSGQADCFVWPEGQ